MSDRNITSPQTNSDITISPSDSKTVKFSRLGGVILGHDSTESNNVKLHRGGAAGLEIVTGSDTTTEGSPSTNRTTVSVKNLVVGSNATPTNNVKLHRSGNSELDIVSGNDATSEGSPSVNRIQVSTKALIVGSDANATNNVKFHRSGASELSIVTGSDGSSEGFTSYTRIKLNVKELVVGNSFIDAENIKLHRGTTGLQFVPSTDSTADGTDSTSFVNISTFGIIPVGGILPILSCPGAYVCTGSGAADINGFVVCGGQTISDATSPLNGQVMPNTANNIVRIK